MKKRIRLTALLSSIVLLITGCWDYHKIDNTYYVYSIGIDYQDNHYIVYTQLINLSQLAAATHAGTLEEADESWTGIGKGKTILEATTQIQLSLENNVDWGHLNAVVFTEKALQHGAKEFFDTILHFYKSRLIQWVFGTDQPLDEVFHTLPIIFRTPYYSLIGHPEDYYQHSSYIKPLRVHRLMQLMHEPGITVLLPKLGIRYRWSGTKENKLPNLSIDGVIPLQEYRAKGKFSLQQMMGLRWLQKDINQSRLFIKEKGEEMAQLECHENKTKINLQLVGKQPKYTIRVEPMCRVLGLKRPIQQKELLQLAQRAIEKEIYDTFQTGVKHQIDLYSLSYEFYHQHPDRWDKHFRVNSSSLQSIEVIPRISDSGTRKIKDTGDRE